MKAFWKEYGLWIELTVLFLALALMIYYKFWEEEQSKLFIRWFQFGLFLFYFIDRLIKLRNRLKKVE